jgi:hypothetical protein
LLKYVPFIKYETVKIQSYLSGLPYSISGKIQYDDTKTMEETIRRKNGYMRSKEKSPLSGRLGKTRRNSIWIREIRELSHPFSETVLKDNQVLESLGWSK